MEIKNKRQKKRYGWLVFFAFLNWLAIGLVVWRVDPDSMRDILIPGSYLPVVVLVSGGFFWLLSILFLSATRAFRWALGITAFLEMRLLGLGTALNGLLILGLLVTWEIYGYTSKTHGTKNSSQSGQILTNEPNEKSE